MSSTTRVSQMAHLKQKQISDNSCKAIIIDTLLETVHPLTREELSGEIAALFHILVSTERLNQLIDTLSQERIILFDTEGHIEITPVHKSDFITNQFQETARGDRRLLLPVPTAAVRSASSWYRPAECRWHRSGRKSPARSSQWPKDCSFPPSPPAQAHWPDEG